MPQRRVLIVDDSAVIRGMITRLIEDDPAITIIGSASNGQMAVQMYKRHLPDIVVMDIEMPVMNGIEALTEIIAFDATAKVIMCSTLTQKNAEVSLQAMTIGAIDYIPKPTSASEVGNSADFKTNLLRMIKAIPAKTPTATAPVPRPAAGTTYSPASTTGAGVAKPTPSSVPTTYASGKFTTREKPLESWRPQILAIGSSTGGPQALFATLKALKDLPIPIVITQHMPATFTAILAQHITSQTGIIASEGAQGQKLEAGHAYIAPGGKHMIFKKDSQGHTIIQIDDGPMENFCKPAVDPMLRSLVDIYGSKILCAILTGMGHDGLAGAKILVEKGGFLYAQDSNTSVVWGMPGAVAMANICSEVLPIDQMGAKLRNIVKS